MIYHAMVFGLHVNNPPKFKTKVGILNASYDATLHLTWPFYSENGAYT